MAGAVDDVTPERLRELAGARAPDGTRVLSLYLDLNPSEFATGEARATEITSVLDEADRRARETTDLPHEGKVALRADVDRARAFFAEDFSAKGTHGLALFACAPAGLFSVLRLPSAAPRRVDIAEAPQIEPLAAIGPPAKWCVLLVNRRHGRVFAGTRWELEEAGDIYDWVPGRAREGGLSEDRYQRSVDEDAKHHFTHVSEAMLERLKQQPFDRLLLAAPEPEYTEVLERLHPYVRERSAGRIDVDVENANAEQVLEAARPVMEADSARRANEQLERLRARIGRGDGAVHGDDAVRDALEQQRVEVLIYDNQADGAIEDAVRAAVLQSADVINVRDADDLAPLGHIAAVLRF
jgi:peptide subunit release factor 1 (eRF1)